ncbi:MAG: DNRLRE domain-containing protein, partial [Actinomycetota bacterium]
MRSSPFPAQTKTLVPGKDLANLNAKQVQPKAVPEFKPPAPKAGGKASHFVEGKSKELVAERTPNAKVFENLDGTKTAKVYGSAVHFKDAGGKWNDIDPKLVPDAGGFKNAAGPFTARFSLTASSPELASLEADGHKVTMSLKDSAGVPGAAVGQEITYPQVRPGVDLSYRVAKTTVKETLLLHKKPVDAAGGNFSFTLDPGDLTPRQEPNGGIGLYGPSDKPVFIIPAARMWDSNVDDKSNEPVYGPASLALSHGTEGWTVDVSGDSAWLADPARKYPVYLDPSFNYWGAGRLGGGLDAYVSDAYPNSTFDNVWNSTLGRYEDKLGYYDASTGTNWDYLFYDLSFLNGKRILNADWWGYFMWAYYSSTPTLYRLIRAHCCWWSGNLTWNNQPGAGPEVFDGYAARNTWDSKDITGWVTNWTNGSWQNSGITMDTFGGGTANWKKLAANENTDGSQSFLAIDYNTTPNADVLVAPGNGANVHSVTPELRVSGSDPDGDALSHYFLVCTQMDGNTCVYSSDWIGSDRVTVPAGLLNWNTTYYWLSYSYDNYDVGNPSAWWSFHTQNSPPTQASPQAPTDGQILGTLTPTLSLNPSTDADNDAILYYIRISEATDGLSGSTSDSGWLVAPNSSWTVPAGALVDGKKYYWTALAIDPYWAFSL